MKYYLNKEVGYAKYIEYLENIILSINEFFDETYACELPFPPPDINKAISIIEENRKRKGK